MSWKENDETDPPPPSSPPPNLPSGSHHSNQRIVKPESRENIPVDLDEFPSVYSNEIYVNGIPNTVVTTPYDDLSTIANDTIGHTVNPWDEYHGSVGGGDYQRQRQQQQHSVPNRWDRPAARAHYLRNNPFPYTAEDLPHSELPPQLSGENDGGMQAYFWGNFENEDRSNPATTSGLSSNVGRQGSRPIVHSGPGQGSAKYINRDYGMASNGKDDDERKKWRRFFVTIAIVGPIISALIVGLTVALILDRDSYDNPVRNDSNTPPQVPTGSPVSFSPPNVPTIAPESPKTVPPFSTPSFVPSPTDFPRTEAPTDYPTRVVPTWPPILITVPPLPTRGVPATLSPGTPTTTIEKTPFPSMPLPTPPPMVSPITPKPVPTPTRMPTPQPTPTPTKYPTRSPTASPVEDVLQPAGGSGERIPLSSMERQFVDLLQSRASSTEYWSAFEDGTVLSNSPQARAITWLTNDPNYDALSDDQRKLQRYALAVFAYATMEDPSDYPGWLDYDTHECDWYTSHPSSSSCSSSSNGYGAWMQRLDLSNAGGRLVGTLPVELGLLSPSLTQLYLSNNAGLSGTLPAVWGRDFQRLERLQLTSANLSGTLPPEWGQMPPLRVLGLGRNRLTGSLPVEWSAHNRRGQLFSLSTLGLEGNLLTGSIPAEWGYSESWGEGFPALVRLALNDNELTGSVPDSLWTGFKAWVEVDLGGNPLSGTISSTTCTIGTLTTLVADCDDSDASNVPTVVCDCCTRCE